MRAGAAGAICRAATCCRFQHFHLRLLARCHFLHKVQDRLLPGFAYLDELHAGKISDGGITAIPQRSQ